MDSYSLSFINFSSNYTQPVGATTLNLPTAKQQTCPSFYKAKNLSADSLSISKCSTANSDNGNRTPSSQYMSTPTHDQSPTVDEDNYSLLFEKSELDELSQGESQDCTSPSVCQEKKKRNSKGSRKNKKLESESKPLSSRKMWTFEDDEVLRQLGVQYKNDWKKIVKRFFTLRKTKKTPNFLRNRFKELTKDSLQKRIKFSHQEDLKLVKLIGEHGMNWMKLGEFFPDRSPIMLKNRYYSFIRKNNLLPALKEEATFEESLEMIDYTAQTQETAVVAEKPEEKRAEFSEMTQIHFELGAPSPVQEVHFEMQNFQPIHVQGYENYGFFNPMQYFGSQRESGLTGFPYAQCQNSEGENSYFPFLNFQMN